jgi:hypothetical protein
VSADEFTQGPSWGGRPVARKVGEVVPRGRVVATGRIVTALTVPVGGVDSYCCVIDDETGQLDLMFLGRRQVPGLAVGRRCTVEGTVRPEGERLVVWNPLYRLEALDLHWDLGFYTPEGGWRG